MSKIQQLSHNLVEDQNEDIICRMCFDKRLPLVNICACKGSMAYVHEECILQWINSQIMQQNSPQLSIPKCQICKEQYSAELQAKGYKLRYEELYWKIKLASWTKILYFLLLVMGLLEIPFVWLIGINHILDVSIDNYLSWILLYVVFPIGFIKEVIMIWRKYNKQVKDCFVQVSQIYLLPKKALKA